MKFFLLKIVLIQILVTTASHSPSQVKYLNPSRGITQRISFTHTANLKHFHHFLEQQTLKREREEEKRNKIYRDYLASQVKSSFMRDFLPMRY
jgi:hypothetical protein